MHKPDPKRILFDRFTAILAMLAAASYDYGIRIWILAAAAAASSLLAERISLYIRKKPFTAENLDSGLIGLVLLLLLPASIPVSLLIMSCIFAIIIGRQLFGGKENPVILPAAAGFAFCMLNNRAAVTLFPESKTHLPILIPDTVTLTDGISFVWNRAGRFSDKALEWLTGLPKQPIGTGSVILLATIALVLIMRRAASGWVIVPAAAVMIVSNLAISNLQHPLSTAVGSLLTNQTLTALIFLHADPDHAPPHIAGIAYGFAVGFLSFFATRILYINDAPVLLAVLLSPLMIALRRALTVDPDTAPAERGTVS